MRDARGRPCHQQAFQDIADANDDESPGTRAAGTEGYARSVEYVADLLEDAGYNVTLDPFAFTSRSAVILQQLTPIDATYESGAFTDSGSGDVTGSVISRRHRPHTAAGEYERMRGRPTSRASTSQADRHRPGAARHLHFAAKALNAEAAGAAAVIIFNQGNTPDRAPA